MEYESYGALGSHQGRKAGRTKAGRTEVVAAVGWQGAAGVRADHLTAARL